MRFVIQGSLGDEVALTAVVREYRAQHPASTLHVDCRYPELFTHNPHLGAGLDDNEVVTFPLDPPHAGNFPRAYASLIDLPLRDDRPELFLTQEERLQAVLRVPLHFVALDTWAGWPSRRWPFERFVRLVDRLEAMGIATVEVGRTVPDCYGTVRRGPLPNVTVSLLDQLPIRETAAVLSLARAYVGNDSGLFHVAAAVRVPQVVIFQGALLRRAYRSTRPVVSPHPACALTPCGETCRAEWCVGLVSVVQVFDTVQQLLAEEAP